MTHQGDGLDYWGKVKSKDLNIEVGAADSLVTFNFDQNQINFSKLAIKDPPENLNGLIELVEVDI